MARVTTKAPSLLSCSTLYTQEKYANSKGYGGKLIIAQDHDRNVAEQLKL